MAVQFDYGMAVCSLILVAMAVAPETEAYII